MVQGGLQVFDNFGGENGGILRERLRSNSSFKREFISQIVGELQSGEKVLVGQIRIILKDLRFACTGCEPVEYVQTVMRVPLMMGWPERTPGRTTTREDVRSAAIISIVVQVLAACVLGVGCAPEP